MQCLNIVVFFFSILSINYLVNPETWEILHLMTHFGGK